MLISVRIKLPYNVQKGERMLTAHTTSISDLRDNLAAWLDSLDESGAVIVLRHSKPAAYLVSPALFEALVERLEDLEDLEDMTVAVDDYRQGQGLPAEEALQRLGL